MSIDDEIVRYRKAAQLTLRQLDWCVMYLHRIHKAQIARALARNSAAIADTLAGVGTEHRS